MITSGEHLSQDFGELGTGICAMECSREQTEEEFNDSLLPIIERRLFLFISTYTDGGGRIQQRLADGPTQITILSPLGAHLLTYTTPCNSYRCSRHRGYTWKRFKNASRNTIYFSLARKHGNNCHFFRTENATPWRNGYTLIIKLRTSKKTLFSFRHHCDRPDSSNTRLFLQRG